mgnify:FL=1
MVKKFYLMFIVAIILGLISSIVIAGVINDFRDKSISQKFNAYYGTDGSGFLTRNDFSEIRNINLSNEAVVSAFNISVSGERQRIKNYTILYDVVYVKGESGAGFYEQQVVSDEQALYVAEDVTFFPPVIVNITKIWKDNASKVWSVGMGNNLDSGGLTIDLDFIYACIEQTAGGTADIYKINKTNGTIVKTLLNSCYANASVNDQSSITTNTTESSLYSTQIDKVLNISKISMTITSTLPLPSGSFFTLRSQSICENTNMVFVSRKNQTFGFTKSPFQESWNSSLSDSGTRSDNMGCIADDSYVFRSHKGQSANQYILFSLNPSTGGTINSITNNILPNFYSGCGRKDSMLWLGCPYFFLNQGSNVYAYNKNDLSINFSYGSNTKEVKEGSIIPLIGTLVEEDWDEGTIFAINFTYDDVDYIKLFRNYPLNFSIDVGNNGKEYINTSITGLNVSTFISFNPNNFTEYLSSNCAFGWCLVPINFSVNSTGIINISQIGLHWTDSTAPRNFNNKTNTTTLRRWDYFHYNVNVSDGNNISSTTFGCNCSVSLINDSPVRFGSTANNYSFSVDKQVNLSRGKELVLKQYTNDSSGNIAVLTMSMIVVNSIPAIPIITPSSLTNKTTNSQALTCQGGDVDNDTLSYEFYADKNNPPTTLKQNTTGTTYGLTFDSTGNWYFRCRSHDAFDVGSYSAATEFYVDFLVPSFRNNGTNTTTPKLNDVVGIYINATDDRGIDTITLQHNFTGSVINVSTKANSVSVINATYNITVTATKNQAIAYRFYINDTIGGMNISPQVFLTVNNTVPTIIHQSQFINISPYNLTPHSFNVSASFEDLDNFSDFINRSITYTSGTCNYLANKTIGTTGLNLTFNCTGTPALSNSVVISMNDSSLSAASTTSVSNVYPNFIPILINVTVNNSPIATQDANLSWNYADLDNDTQGGFTIYWYKNGIIVPTANNSRYLTSDNYTTNDLINATVNVTDGFESSLLYNTPVVTVGDATPPQIRSVNILFSQIYTTGTNNLTIIVNDSASNIQSCNFNLNTPTTSLNRNFALPSGQKNVTVSYKIFETSETASAGTYNVSQVQCSDSSSNTNTTTINSINFSVVAVPTPIPPSGGGGGGGNPCDKGYYFNLSAGRCVPVNVTVISTNETWRLIPEQVSSPHFPLSWFSKNFSSYAVVLKSTRVLKSCDVLGGENFTCSIIDGTAVQVRKVYFNENFFSHVDKGQLRVINSDGTVKFVPIQVTIINPAFSIRFGSVVNPIKQFPTLSVANVKPSDGLGGFFVAKRGDATEIRVIPLLLLFSIVMVVLWRLGRLERLESFLNAKLYNPLRQVFGGMLKKRLFSSKKGRAGFFPLVSLVHSILFIKFKKSALKRTIGIAVITLLLSVILVSSDSFTLVDSGGIGSSVNEYSLVVSSGELEKTPDTILKFTNYTNAAIKDGSGVYVTDKDMGLINQSKEVVLSGEKVESTFTKLQVKENYTIAVQDNDLNIVSFEVFETVEKQTPVYNTSVVLKDWGNGTVEPVYEKNMSYKQSFINEWVGKKTSRYEYDGGVTASGITTGVVNLVYRYVVVPKQYGGVIKYSIYSNFTKSLLELDPILNATAINITSNADLNLTVSAARFVDGKIVAGAGNRSNLTGWDTWSDGEWFNNPQWVQVNISQADTVGHTRFVSLSNGIINITSQSVTPASSGMRNSFVRNVNTSIPEVTGVVAAWWMKFPYDSLANSGAIVGACFVEKQVIINATGSSNGDCSGSGADYAIVEIVLDGGVSNKKYSIDPDLVYFGKKSDDWVHMTWWINKTHQRMIVNYTEGTSADSNIRTLTGNLTAGFFSFYMASGSTDVAGVLVANFSVANISDLGMTQPLNLTPAVFETSVLNSTASVANVKVVNQTLANRNSAATFQVFNANHTGTQNIVEGNNTLTSSITGIGMNATLHPKDLYLTSEFTSFLVEYSAEGGGDVAVSSCGDLDVADTAYTLINNLENVSTCFQVKANNITLDCQGYTVGYANFTAGYGINSTGFNATTIKNCIFLKQNDSVTDSNAIYVERSNSSIIINNTINSTGNYSMGVSLNWVNFTNITGNIVNVSANSSYAIGLGNSHSNNITDNNLSALFGTNGVGVNLTSSGLNSIMNNIVITNGTGGSNYGLRLTSANDNVMSNNTIQTWGTTNNAGIIATASVRNVFANNFINASGSTTNNIGFSFASGTSYNVLSNNVIRTGGTDSNRGLVMASNSWYNNISDNVIFAGGTGRFCDAIQLDSVSYNNITNNNVTSWCNYQNYVVSFRSSHYNLVADNVLLLNTIAATKSNAIVDVTLASLNNTIKNNRISSDGDAIALTGLSVNITITGNNITPQNSGDSGIKFTNLLSSAVTGNIIKTTGSGGFGMRLINSNGSLIYDNVFNTTDNPVNVTNSELGNNFSTSLTSGTNIVGGSYIGGNFYDNSTSGSGQRYSLNCTDADSNGICDSALSFDSGNNTDYYPLTLVTNIAAVPLNPVNITFPIAGSGTNVTSINFTGLNVNHALYIYSNGSFMKNVTENTTITLTYGEGEYLLNFSVSNFTHWTGNYSLNYTFDNVTPTISIVPNTPANNSFINRADYFVNVTTLDGTETSAFVDFNNSLVGYWRFENGSGTSVSDFSTYGNTGTFNGFACTTLNCNTTSGWVSGAKRGNGLAFDGKNDYVIVTNSQSLNITQALSIEAWIKTYSTAYDRRGIVEKSGATAQPYAFDVRGLGLHFRTYNGSQYWENSFDNTIPAAGVWTHVAATVGNGRSLKVYVNGVLAGTGGVYPAFIGSPNDLRIGYDAAEDKYFNGSIDEIKIWNRILNLSEIKASYSAGINSYSNNFTSLGDGNYSYRAFVVDAAGNINSTLNQSFVVDTTVPRIGFGLNSDLNDSFVNRNWVFMNFSWNETYNHTFTIHNGTTNWLSVNASSLTYFSYNFTNLNDANYTFFGSVNDSAGNRNVTLNRTVVVDTTSPNINLTLPTNNSAISLMGNALNFSVSDLYLNNSWYKLVDKYDGSVEIDNRSLVGFANTTFNILNYHTFTLTLFVNDKSGNLNQTSVELITNAPSVNPDGGSDNKGGGGGGSSGSGLTIDLMCAELKTIIEFRKGLLLESDYVYVQERIYANTSKNVSIDLLKSASTQFNLYCPHLTLDYSKDNLWTDLLSVAANVTQNITIFQRVNDSLVIPSAGISIPLFKSVPLAFLIYPASVNVGMPSEGWMGVLRFFFSLEYADFEQTSVVVTGTQLWVYIVILFSWLGINKWKRKSFTKFTKKQKHNLQEIVGKKVGAMRNSSTSNAK